MPAGAEVFFDDLANEIGHKKMGVYNLTASELRLRANQMLAAAILLSAAINLDDLIARVMQTYGGAAAWEKVTSFRETGTVTPAMRPGEGKLTREWQRPDKLRVEIVYPTNTEVRVVEGDHGTQNGKEATGMGLDAMRLQAARLGLPLLLEQKKSSLRGAGENTIEILLAPQMTLTIEVDPASGHIIKSVGKAEGIEFTTRYSDFRMLDGLLFAFREENSAQGTKTGTNEIDKIELTRTK